MPGWFASGSAQAALRAHLQRSRERPPPDWKPWRLEGCDCILGWLSPDRARLLAQSLPTEVPLALMGDGWLWRAGSLDAARRSGVLQAIAENWRGLGLLPGWRGEAFACWGYRDDVWPYREPELFRLERAAFRVFGLRSHAVHVHGLTRSGRMWCGRRSLDKQTDPGLLDNIAAGGLGAGEDAVGCAARELWEEAGLQIAPDRLRRPFCSVVTERRVPEGWHSERLLVSAVLLGDDQVPENRDGEVSAFRLLAEDDILRLIDSGDFTQDAACAIAEYFTQ